MNIPEIKHFQGKQRGDVFYETEKSLKDIFRDIDTKLLELLVIEDLRYAIMFTFSGVNIYKTRSGIMNFFFEDAEKRSEGEYYFSKELIDDQLVFENFHRKSFPLRQKNGTEHLKQIEELFRLIKQKLSLSFDLMFTQIENQKSTQGWLKKNDYLLVKKGKELIGIKNF